MDARTDPFTVGPGVRPLSLWGREDLLDRFTASLDRLEAGRFDAAPIFTGSRGVGKTVLLNECCTIARNRGWHVAREEVDPNTPLAFLVAVMAHEILINMSTENRLKESVRRALGLLRAFTSVSALGVQISIDVDKVSGADSGLFSRDLRTLFLEIGSIARAQGRGVVFAFDEIHSLFPHDLDAVHAAMHAVGQEAMPILLLGAGLFPYWMRTNADTSPLRISSYVARLQTSAYRRIPPLSPQQAHTMLADTAATASATVSDQASTILVSFCEGNPWLLQLAGSESWTQASSVHIDAAAARRAVEQVDERLRSNFFPRLLRSFDADESTLVSVLSSFPAHDVPLGDFMARCRTRGLQDQRDVARTLDHLGWRDIVVTRDVNVDLLGYDVGSIAFSVPRLAECLRSMRAGAASDDDTTGDPAMQRTV